MIHREGEEIHVERDPLKARVNIGIGLLGTAGIGFVSLIYPARGGLIDGVLATVVLALLTLAVYRCGVS